ncbi:MAG TPA: NUDIX hydrolase [Candidatus Tumulicola sp.]|jgi:8-oxo-dGTP pyrophosphatase MutT (NUDIX family)
MTHVHLAHALVVRDGFVLLVASRYAGRERPLWNIPGGRQQPGELLYETAQRELFEETGLRGIARELAYVNESYDEMRHFVAAVFCTSVEPGEIRLPGGEDHVNAVAWVAIDELHSREIPDVVRDPLAAYLQGRLVRRYAGRHDAGISIRWPDEG